MFSPSATSTPKVIFYQTTKKPWRKVLYGNFDYADNYTDPSFLKDLRKNLNVRLITFREAFAGATKLNQQISCIVGFLIVYGLLYTERVTPTSLLLPSGLTTAIGYSLYHGPKLRWEQLIEDSKTLVAVLVFGYLFAPVLHTLTAAISTDTIYALTFIVMVLNLVLFDYGLQVALVSKPLSLNAALFGSICLASRLKTSYHAFVLLVEAAAFFVLLPSFTAVYWQPFYLVPMVGVCAYALLQMSMILLFVYLLGVIFVNFICPWAFLVHQQHKRNIHGPWDEVMLDDEDRDLKEKKRRS